ncbi:MAG: DUF2141 domain-containing protein [Owenweeksia sp.]
MASGISAQHKLTIHFEGMASDKGQVLVKIVDENNEQISGHELKINTQRAALEVELPNGRYAVSAFHDANNNKKLDTNWVGIPTEKYGFSNNARGTFGPPSLKDQLVEVSSDKSISITLK